MNIITKKAKGNSIFEEYSKNLAKDFDHQVRQCKTDKDIDKFLDVGVLSFDTFVTPWLFLKRFKIAILVVLL